MSNDKKIAIALIAVAAVVGGFGLIQVLNEPVATESATLPGIGDTVTVRDRTIEVKEVRTIDSISVSNQFADPIEGAIVVVQFGVKNTGGESGNLMFSSFELQDSQGRVYNEITDMTYSLWRDDLDIKARSEDLYPGESRLDLAAFRVAPGASGFTLLWDGEEISLGE